MFASHASRQRDEHNDRWTSWTLQWLRMAAVVGSYIGMQYVWIYSFGPLPEPSLCLYGMRRRFIMPHCRVLQWCRDAVVCLGEKLPWAKPAGAAGSLHLTCCKGAGGACPRCTTQPRKDQEGRVHCWQPAGDFWNQTTSGLPSLLSCRFQTPNPSDALPVAVVQCGQRLRRSSTSQRSVTRPTGTAAAYTVAVPQLTRQTRD